MKQSLRFKIFLFLVPFIILAVNYNWVRAATIASFSPKCSVQLITDAKKEVASLFGSVRSRPILACQTESILGYKVDFGTASFAPLLPSVVLLGPSGMNADVAAHEYGHAELAERTSVLLRTYKIPTWFDEGLAMQLDNRSGYSMSALKSLLKINERKLPRLREISKPSTFFKAGDEGKMHYAFARCVVGAWIEENGKAELIDLINKVAWSKPFPKEHFENFENFCHFDVVKTAES